MRDAEPRPLLWLREYGRRYPGAWKRLDALRERRGKELPDWPEWCYLPMAASHALVGLPDPEQAQGMPAPEVLARLGDIGALSALVAWRQTKGIYRFDPDFGAAVAATDLAGDLPSDLLLRLPEWCVYVEAPGLPPRWHGFFAHLEWDANTGERELRIVGVGEAALAPFPVHLGGRLVAGVQATVDQARASVRAAGLPEDVLGHTPINDMAAFVRPAVNLVLYLCSDEPDLAGQGRPGNPRPVQRGREIRTEAAASIREWQVGWRLGASFRAARDSGEQRGAGGHASPRPHVRRAHWHHYWTGPREGERKSVLRWLHPMLVGTAGASIELPAVVRPVKRRASREGMEP